MSPFVNRRLCAKFASEKLPVTSSPRVAWMFRLASPAATSLPLIGALILLL